MRKWEYEIVGTDSREPALTQLKILGRKGFRVVPITMAHALFGQILMERKIPESPSAETPPAR